MLFIIYTYLSPDDFVLSYFIFVCTANHCLLWMVFIGVVVTRECSTRAAKND